MGRIVSYKITNVDESEVVETGFAEVSKELSLYSAEDMSDLAFDISYQFLLGDKSLTETEYEIVLTQDKANKALGVWAFSIPETFDDHLAPTFYNYAPGGTLH